MRLERGVGNAILLQVVPCGSGYESFDYESAEGDKIRIESLFCYGDGDPESIANDLTDAMPDYNFMADIEKSAAIQRPIGFLEV